MNVIRHIFSATLIAAALGVSLAAAVAAVSAPEAMVRSTVEDVMGVIRTTKDKHALRQTVEEKVLPKFDFKEMTRSAVGPGWNNASPKQQDALQSGFRAILVNTYTAVLSEPGAHDAIVEFKPGRVQAGQDDAMVKTVVKQTGRPLLQIDYRLSIASGDWKVHDVLVGGISLITNYRSSFSEEINRSGVDGLIRVLEQKNRSM